MEDQLEWISDEAFEKDWKPIQERLVVTPLDDEAPSETPFKLPTWELALIAGPLYDHGLNDELYHYPKIEPAITYEAEPIFWALEKYGVTRVVLSRNLSYGGELIPEYFPTGCVITDASLAGIQRVPPTFYDMPTVGVAMFDVTAEWCAVCYVHDRCTYLGGTPKFMQTFYEVAGGKEAVIKRFQHNDYLGTCDFMRDEQQERVNAIYALAGWPVPEYPDEPYPIEKGPHKGKLPRF